MPEFVNPGWLPVGFLVAALVWWMHAQRPGGAPLDVPALYPWPRDAALDTQAASRARRERRWLLRAAAAALICIAAAGPELHRDVPAPLEVWVDDRPSLRAREAEGRRYEIAARALASALAAEEVSAVAIRSLRRPAPPVWRHPDEASEALLSLFSGDLASSPRRLPAPVALASEHRHWLVTDGADEALDGWLARAPVTRAIQVGERDVNVAVTTLAVRPSAARPGHDSLLAVVSNLGGEVVERTVNMSAGEAWHRDMRARLGPRGGADASVTFLVSVPALARGATRVWLSPGDAMDQDDGLSVDSGSLRPAPVEIPAHCPDAIRVVLAAHPGLELLAPGGPSPELAVRCGPGKAPVDVPVLRFLEAGGSGPPPSSVEWADVAGELARLELDPQWLRYRETVDGSGEPLLYADDRALITMHPGPPVRLQVALDVDRSPLVRQPEFAVLMAGLVDRALGRAVLDPVVATYREPVDALIKPRRLSAVLGTTSSVRIGKSSLAAPIVVIAMMLVTLDLMLLLLPRRRHGTGALPVLPGRR